MSIAITNPELISRFKKERFLRDMSEDDFRDRVIRPLFIRQGLKDGRDLCGPTEKGKDAVFMHEDLLGIRDWYVVQTKRGPLNLSGKASANLLNAVAQLRTALDTPIPLVAERKSALASKVFLCASGKINESARQHIVSEIKDRRLVFLDSDDLIPRIDEIMPEVWLGIDSDAIPYLKAVKSLVDNPGEDQFLADLVPERTADDAATDSMFVQLRLFRTTFKPQKTEGQVKLVPDFEDLAVTSVLERLERLVMLVGDPGSGKSTSLKRLAYILASRGLDIPTNHKIPVLLRATDIWAQHPRGLTEIAISATAALVERSAKTTFTDDDLHRGRVVLLIDALDEVSEDAARAAVLKTAKDFHLNYPKCQIIVTTRDYAFVKSMEGVAEFAQFRLFPINYRQAEQIIQRFEKKKSLPPERSKEILRRLQEVHGMELNPLLVTVFAATSEYSRQDVPANITELFKKYTEWMLGRWNRGKGLGQQYHAPLKDFLLKRIAFEMHRRQETNVPLSEFLLVLEQELTSRGHEADIKQLSEEILNHSGFFRLFGDRVEFRHHLLQEFFAGRGIPNFGFLESVISEEWWQRAIVFYFGENPGDADSFYSLMAACERRRVLERYSAALTVGLALQACYLMPTIDKAKIFPWVVATISDAKELFFRIVDHRNRRPLTRFAAYYLTARDSIASRIVVDHIAEIEERLLSGDLTDDQRDIRGFWLIIGLLECGALERARQRLRDFKPADPRLLLAIHMGSFLIQHHRVVDASEKKIAREICDSLGDVVRDLRNQLFHEFKSEMLELRKGVIAPLAIPSTAQEEADLLGFGDEEMLAGSNEVADEGFMLLDAIEAHA